MLTYQDRQQIVKLFVSQPMLATEKGRRAFLVNAGLEDILPQVDLEGASGVVLPILINFAENYGYVSYQHHVLGRMLNTIKDYLGLEEQKLIDGWITKYKLMVPAVIAPESEDWDEPVSAQDYLERIIGENTLRPIAYLQKALWVARSVAYLEIHQDDGSWSGTGFMLSRNLLLTNNHVIPSRETAHDCIVRFNYQLDAASNPEIYQDYKVVSDGIFQTNQHLDYTLLEIDKSPGDQWGFLSIARKLPGVNQRVSIIQHPHGLPKTISLQNNFVKYVGDKIIQYVTSTEPGSSGSPVFNDDWNVVGLHHAGGMLPEGDGGPLYFRNEGININAIIKDLPEKLRSQLEFSAR